MHDMSLNQVQSVLPWKLVQKSFFKYVILYYIQNHWLHAPQ